MFFEVAKSVFDIVGNELSIVVCIVGFELGFGVAKRWQVWVVALIALIEEPDGNVDNAFVRAAKTVKK